ncbi:MAG: ArgE/DapE family deacylase [Haliea sp.]
MLADIEQTILDSCDDLFPQVIDFISEMVRQYAILDNETPVLELVERHMNDLRLPVQRIEIDSEHLAGHPLFAPVGWDYKGKYNLVSAINPGAAGRSLVLNGHLDVVPADPFDMWTRPPNEPWEHDGWLYGRGAGDMQAGVATMIYATIALREAGLVLKSPLTIQTVVEEECTGNGALACLDRGFGGDFVLIPEPFGPQILAGQSGVLWFTLTCQGTPAHVLDTAAGRNAIEILQSVVPFLQDLEETLNTQYRVPPYDQLDHPFNLNLGTLSGGNWASSVPAYAEMELRIGFPPGMSPNRIMQLVRERVELACARVPELAAAAPNLRFSGFRSEGHLVDLQHPGIRLLSECHHSLTGHDPDHFLATCTTDLRAFHCHSGISGTCYGPIAQRIHGVDECVNIESVRHTLKTLALFISRWGDIATDSQARHGS